MSISLDAKSIKGLCSAGTKAIEKPAKKSMFNVKHDSPVTLKRAEVNCLNGIKKRV